MLFIEEAPYTKQTICHEIDEYDFNLLLRKGLLEAVPKIDSYKFIFVGVVSLKSKVLFIYPKVYCESKWLENSYKSLSANLVQCFKKYKHLAKELFDDVDFFVSNPENDNCSEIAVADFILNDFISHGIYRIDEQVLLKEHKGVINWDYTLNHIDPIFSQSRPIYNETINALIVEDLNDLLTEVHKWAVNFSSERYSELLGHHQLKLNFSAPHNLKEIADAKQILNLITNRLQATYTDRNIRLLKSLLFLVTQSTNTGHETLSLFGTRNFHNIWENCCRTILYDSYEVIKKEAGELIPPSVWTVFDKTVEKNSDLRPDILVEDKEAKRFFIFDAKYYNLDIEMLSNSISISNAPGTKDIFKQFFYYTFVRNKRKSYSITNAFLFPASSDTIQKTAKRKYVEKNKYFYNVGYIENKLFKQSRIYVIYFQIDIVLDLFLAGEKIPTNFYPAAVS